MHERRGGEVWRREEGERDEGLEIGEGELRFGEGKRGREGMVQRRFGEGIG